MYECHDWCRIAYRGVRCMRRARVDKTDRSVYLCRYYYTWVFYESFSWIHTWSKHRMGEEESILNSALGSPVSSMGNSGGVKWKGITRNDIR